MNSKTILGALVSLCLVASASAIDDKKKKVKAGSSVKIEKVSKEKKTIKSARKSKSKSVSKKGDK